MRGGDDGKQKTWTGTANSGQGDSQRGDLELGSAVGTTEGNVGEAWNGDRGPSGDLSGRSGTRLRPLRYGSRGGGENNDSILRTSCCVPV